MHSSQSKGKEPERGDATSNGHQHSHDHDHQHEHEEHKGHSHSIFSFGHSHAPGEGHGDSAEKVVEVLKGGGDRGSRITVIGLVSNVGLTAAKGAAGWYMNSAALLADAGHSLSDLVGDFVTLFCWKLSRSPPSERYPYGFGKFEVLGTTAVSLLLTGGALLFGLHSWGLLMEALQHTVAELPAGAIHDILLNVTEVGQHVPVIASEHAHAHEHALDPNAAWFAAISVIAKEWLYRATKKVADDERSPVLAANALHHRSDAYGSAVALVAILGTWFFPHLPLDPLGGLLVSFLIIQQGWGLTTSSFLQLTDAGVSSNIRKSLQKSLTPLLSTSSSTALSTYSFPYLLAVRDVRAMHAGASMYVDLVAEVPNTYTVEQTTILEEEIVRLLKQERKEVSEVRVKFRPVAHAS
ncbi:hypothetical protein QCA50_021075 [Cerrena zonata]|uniref:Cation efflux protein transmembrane domain-containing protein n=1 Tax=Cerrena zonata TaxID=2478898 RepID=A0AAW0FAX6_9APHY